MHLLFVNNSCFPSWQSSAGALKDGLRSWILVNKQREQTLNQAVVKCEVLEAPCHTLNPEHHKDNGIKTERVSGCVIPDGEWREVLLSVF